MEDLLCPPLISVSMKIKGNWITARARRCVHTAAVGVFVELIVLGCRMVARTVDLGDIGCDICGQSHRCHGWHHGGRGPDYADHICCHVDGRGQVVASVTEVMGKTLTAEIVATLFKVASVALVTILYHIN